jgi:hypothetical protein
MKRLKYKIISEYKIISIYLCGILLTSCGNPQDTPDSTPLPPSQTPTISQELINPTTPATESTPSPTTSENNFEAAPTVLTPTLALDPIFIPESNHICTYVNYANSFPLVITDHAIVQFYYDDTVSVAHESGHRYRLSLSEIVTCSEADLSNPDLWYFCGAFQLDNTVYAHFDYLNGETNTPSLLIRIQPEVENAEVSCCIFSWNPKKHFQDCFAFTDQYIYYTSTDNADTATTDILRTDRNGENLTTFYQGLPGETIRYMTCDGNYLSYMITDKKENNRLISIELSTGNEILLSAHISSPDFLIGWNGYLFTSNQNGKFTYFDCTAAIQKTITYTNNPSISAGYPLTDGKIIYLPLINYSSEMATLLLPLDLAENNMLEEIYLNDTYYYSVGMINNNLYTENMESYIIFDITGQN